MSVLSGRSAIITGASHGLGLAIARSYACAGANVLICGRDGEALEQARSQLSELGAGNQKVEAHRADVSNPGDVGDLVGAGLQVFGELDILVNNAGVYGPKGYIEDVDWEEWVEAVAVNLFGSVLMCRAVLPHFKNRNYGKIVQLSGGGATGPLPHISAYASAKAAIVRFVETLAEEVGEWQIDVNAIAPGALNTRMLEEVLEAGPQKVGQAFYDKAVEQSDRGGTPLENGADLAVFLASAASDGITGKLISAVWDPWDSLPAHVDDLRQSDVYTLRRIVPKDRGLAWGDS